MFLQVTQTQSATGWQTDCVLVPSTPRIRAALWDWAAGWRTPDRGRWSARSRDRLSGSTACKSRPTSQRTPTFTPKPVRRLQGNATLQLPIIHSSFQESWPNIFIQFKTQNVDRKLWRPSTILTDYTHLTTCFNFMHRKHHKTHQNQVVENLTSGLQTELHAFCDFKNRRVNLDCDGIFQSKWQWKSLAQLLPPSDFKLIEFSQEFINHVKHQKSFNFQASGS